MGPQGPSRARQRGSKNMAGHGHGGDHGGEGHKGVALLIAVLALFLAIAETGAKSAQTEALAKNVEAANLWAFFQARSIRQTTVRTAAEQAALGLGAATEEQKAGIQRQIDNWRGAANRWESEPETGEGRRELMARRATLVKSENKGARSRRRFGPSGIVWRFARSPWQPEPRPACRGSLQAGFRTNARRSGPRRQSRSAPAPPRQGHRQ